MEQKSRLTTVTSNRVVVAKRLVGGKSCDQGRLSFLDTKNSEIGVVQATDESREPVVHSAIASSQTTAIEEEGFTVPSSVGEPPPDRFPTGKGGRGLVQWRLQKPTQQPGGAGSKQPECRQ